MKEYLKKFIGKKIGLQRVGFLKETHISGTLKEIVGDVAVLVTKDNEELGIPMDKILIVGPPEESKESRSAGFTGDRA